LTKSEKISNVAADLNDAVAVIVVLVVNAAAAVVVVVVVDDDFSIKNNHDYKQFPLPCQIIFGFCHWLKTDFTKTIWFRNIVSNIMANYTYPMVSH
jgi:hypothetical protein